MKFEVDACRNECDACAHTHTLKKKLKLRCDATLCLLATDKDRKLAEKNAHWCFHT